MFPDAAQQPPPPQADLWQPAYPAWSQQPADRTALGQSATDDVASCARWQPYLKLSAWKPPLALFCSVLSGKERLSMQACRSA